MKKTCKILVLVLALSMLFTMASMFTVSAATPEKLYLTPNANWKSEGARFAAYFFGNGEKWVSMTDPDGDGIYEVTVPAGYPSVIFCRMNPNNATNSWDTRYNQTADLTVPTDGPNHYTVKEGTWDKGGGTWSTFGSSCEHANLGEAATCTTPQKCLDCGDPVVSELGHTYNASHLCTRCNAQATFTVAGTGAHLGTEWDTGNTANDMTYADGVYTKVYTNVAAGSYKFKVARDHDWGTAYPDADKSYTVATAGSTVTITLKGTAVDVKVEAPHVHEFVEGKCACGEEDPNYVPAHVNTLVVGDTNKIVVSGATLNDGGLPIEWVAFVADEAAYYSFIGDNGVVAVIFDSNLGLVSATGAANLEAGTYLICLGNGLVGEFNVAVTKAPLEVPQYDWWVSDGSLYTVDGDNIKYNGAGNTYACVGCDVTALALGKNTFTITITNNGASTAKVRVDLQATVQVGNHKVVNTGAVGGDVWTDSDWGGSHVHVAPGESVTLVITYDGCTERGAVKDLIIFADSGRGDAETYSADITVSGMEFSYVKSDAPHDNALAVGNTNKIVIDDGQDNGYGYYVELVPFVVEEAARYSFAGEGLTIWLYDANNALLSMTGEANLEAGTYYVFIAANTLATTGEFNVAVTKSAWVNTLAEGANKLLITDALDNGADYYIVWVPFEVTEKANYTFTGEGILALVFDEAYQAVTGTELEAGTYNICVAFLTTKTTGVATLNVEKVSDIPVVEDPALALGDNTVVIDGSQVNLTNNPVAWYTFTPEVAGTYTFTSDLTVYILTSKNMADLSAYVGNGGVADLEAGVKYHILVGKEGITGEFNVNVSVGGEVVEKNTMKVGDNHYIVTDALISAKAEYLYLTITEPGTYVIKGAAPLKFYVWTIPVEDLEDGLLTTKTPFVWNVDAETATGFTEYFTVTFDKAGTYWVGFNYDFIGEQREFDINISLHTEHTFEEGKCTECGAADPDYVAPEAELNFFQKIIAWFMDLIQKLLAIFKK